MRNLSSRNDVPFLVIDLSSEAQRSYVLSERLQDYPEHEQKYVL